MPTRRVMRCAATASGSCTTAGAAAPRPPTMSASAVHRRCIAHLPAASGTATPSRWRAIRPQRVAPVYHAPRPPDASREGRDTGGPLADCYTIEIAPRRDAPWPGGADREETDVQEASEGRGERCL